MVPVARIQVSLEQRDTALRIALFAHVQKLRERLGGIVTSSALNEGMEFEGRRQPVWNQQQGIYKPQWLGADGAALTIQTSYKSPYDDRLPSDAGADDRFIYRYRGTRVDHPDNRALRAAMLQGRPLLYLVARAPGIYDAEFPFYVVADRPDDLAFELMADALGDLTASVGRPVDYNLPNKAYATRLVRHRLHQNRFRHLVLAAYRRRCTMCQLRHEPLLDAAHIVPDSEERGLPEIPNGLALCKIHHSAFDIGILGIDPDYRIHLRRDVLDETDGPMLRHGLQALHGESIILPRTPAHHPNREYLAHRFERFRAA